MTQLIFDPETKELKAEKRGTQTDGVLIMNALTFRAILEYVRLASPLYSTEDADKYADFLCVIDGLES